MAVKISVDTTELDEATGKQYMGDVQAIGKPAITRNKYK